MLGCGSRSLCLRFTVPRNIDKHRYDDVDRYDSADSSIDTTAVVGVQQDSYNSIDNNIDSSIDTTAVVGVQQDSYNSAALAS